MTALPLLAAALAFAIGWRLGPQLLPAPLMARVRALDTPRATAIRPWPAPVRGAVERLDRVAGWLAARAGAAAQDKAETRARLAGWAPERPAARLIAAALTLPILLPLAGLVLVAGGDPVQQGAILLLLAGAGRVGPALFAANMAARRIDAITNGLPDAVDLLVICADAGLGLDVALARTARELEPAAPALARELALTATELRLLPHRATAFANLARRLPLPQLQTLADMLVQTERFGTPLAQALRIMAAEYRTGRLLRAEAKAARLPAMMTVPMIAFILPPLFVVLIGPAVVESMR